MLSKTREQIYAVAIALLVMATLSSVAQASPTVITFDDLTASSGGSGIPDGYNGFNWNGVEIVGSSYYPGSGYQTGAVSRPNVAYTASDADFPADFATADGSAFTLVSFYLTSAWHDDNIVTVTGEDNGIQLYTAQLVANTSGPVLETFNWSGINEVVLTSSAWATGGGQAVYDNITVDTGSPVPAPAPASLALLGFGLIGMRRKTTAA